MKKIWGEIPMELLGTEIQKGTFSQAVMSFFLIYVILKIISLILGDASKRVKGHLIFEILVGSILVNISIHLDPMVTPDKILIYICCFMLINWGLMVITKVFKISTRHFGSFEKIIYQAYGIAVAADKNEERKDS